MKEPDAEPPSESSCNSTVLYLSGPMDPLLVRSALPTAGLTAPNAVHPFLDGSFSSMQFFLH